MRHIEQWPDPRTGELIDHSTRHTPGPFRDEYFMSRAKTVAQSAVPVAHSNRRQPAYYGLNISNERNSMEPSRNHFNGKRKP